MEKIRPPMIKTLRQFQEVEGHMSTRLDPNTTLDRSMEFLREEMVELEEAVGMKDRLKIAQELPDILIFVSKIANHFSIDLGEAVSWKFARNAEKYQKGLNELLEQGKSHEEARQILKDRWPRHLDNNFNIDQ